MVLLDRLAEPDVLLSPRYPEDEANEDRAQDDRIRHRRDTHGRASHAQPETDCGEDEGEDT
jgi:hypothetical protein